MPGAHEAGHSEVLREGEEEGAVMEKESCRGCRWLASDCAPPDCVWYFCVNPKNGYDADGWEHEVGIGPGFAPHKDCAGKEPIRATTTDP